MIREESKGRLRRVNPRGPALTPPHKQKAVLGGGGEREKKRLKMPEEQIPVVAPFPGESRINVPHLSINGGRILTSPPARGFDVALISSSFLGPGSSRGRTCVAVKKKMGKNRLINKDVFKFSFLSPLLSLSVPSYFNGMKTLKINLLWFICLFLFSFII